MPSLVIDSVTKHYGAFRAIKGVSFSVEPGEFIVMVGPSGCGKSTLLRIIAGLEPITAGRVIINDRDVTQSRARRPRRRDGLPELRALSAHECRPEHGFWAENALAAPSAEVDAAVRRAAEILQITEHLDQAGRRSFPVGRSSASRSAAPSRARPTCSFSTSRSPTSMRRSGRRCGSSFPACTPT